MLGQGPVPFSHGAVLRTSRYLGCYFSSVGIRQAGIMNYSLGEQNVCE